MVKLNLVTSHNTDKTVQMRFCRNLKKKLLNYYLSDDNIEALEGVAPGVLIFIPCATREQVQKLL